MKKGFNYTITLLICAASFQMVLAQSLPLSNPSSCHLGLEIVDNNCPDGQVYYSPNKFQINVNNVFGTRLGTDVYLKEVHLIIQHEWAGDLDISLISPSGKSIRLSYDNGGGEDNYGDPYAAGCGVPMVFSMAACKSIKDNLAPFLDGPYQPEESFFLFNDNATNPNGIWTLQICDDAADDVGSLEFVELVFESITCLPITNVSVLDIDTTTVKLAWEPDDCAPVIIEYGPPGFTPGTGFNPGEGQQAFTNACSPYSLKGLQPFTEYDVYIRRSCNFGANYSSNSCPIRIKTSCLPPPATIVENFDSYDEICSPTCGAVCEFPGIWRNVTDDDFDWILYQGGTPTVNTGPNGDVNGGSGKYVYLESSGTSCNNGKQTHLVSNCIRINKQGSDTCNFAFNYHMWGVNTGILRLQYSIDGGATWTTMWEKSGNQGNAWRKVYLSLNQFTDGQIVRFRFVGIGGNGSRGDIALDNIVFFGSEDLGQPDTPYYVDADHDGYGNPNQFIFSCLDSIPPGYTLIGGDCNDNDPTINPGAPEIPCNNIDNNCNGNADESILPTPLVANDTICSGALAVLAATPLSGKPIFWYGSPDGNDILGTGNSFFPNLPENNSPVPVIYHFYAEETDFVCRSGTRAEAVVVVNPRPDLVNIDNPSICPGESFDLGSLTIQDANFTGSTITFHSGTPATTANKLPSTIVKPTTTTTYYYLATSPDGCTDENSVTISLNQPPSLSFTPTKNFSLCLQDDGIVTVLAGGTGGYHYLWNTGDTTASIRVQADTLVGALNKYVVVVTDAKGCIAKDTVNIITTNSINTVGVSTVPVSSCTGNDGSFTITPLGGRLPFTYAWRSSNGESGSVQNVNGPVTIHNLPQGAYNITITDSSPEGCQVELRQVIINGPATVVNKTQIRDVSCPGTNDGSITLSIVGGNPTYHWSNGATTASIQNIPGGTYEVTITDGVCETVLSDLIVQEPEPLKALQTLTEPSCAESTNGIIDLSVFGGTKNYSFLWNTGSRREDLNNIAAGNYQVTITDAKGCTLQEAIRLNAPSPLQIQTDSVKNITCTNLNDGYLKIQANGGTMPYRYAWNNGSISSVLPNLSANSYTATVTDFKGCQKIQTFQVTQPNALNFHLVSQVNPRCVGDTNGALQLEGQGGTAPYDFRWNIGATSASLNNLQVGEYTVTLTDANGCFGGSQTFNLTASSPISATLQVTQPECLGQQDGTILLQPNGSAPFKYRWSRGDATQNLNSVGAGNYSVTVEDAQGCLLDTMVTVTAPQAFNLNFGISQPSCYQSTDGIIQVNFLKSGTPPFTYQWSNGSTTKDLANLSQGDYVLSLTDTRGCRLVTDTIAIRNPPPLELSSVTLGQIACRNDSTGFIEVDLRGGTPPYRYNWVNLNKQTAAIYNLPGGNYRLVIQDKNNCPIDTVFRLTEPTELIADVEVRISGECDAQYSNQLRARVSGGRAPYLFEWSNGATDSILVNVPAGDYTLKVQDANGCIKEVSSIKVRGAGTALAIDTFFVKNITCFSANDGKMTVRIAGGAPPFQFHFSNGTILKSNEREVTVESLPVNNNYSVTVTDLGSGCTVASAKRSISEPLPLSFIFDNLNEPNCFSSADGAIYASTYGGIAPYSYRWFNAGNVVVGTTEDLLHLPNGVYTGIVTDANGCVDTINQQVSVQNNRELIRMSQYTVKDVKCKGDRTGAIDVTITGGKSPYTYRWSNNRTTEDITNVPASAYSLTVTDADTCRIIFPPIKVSEPDSKVSITGKVNDVRCYGDTTGSIEVLVQGGKPPYQLIWEYGGNIFVENTSSLVHLAAGNYALSVRDTNQCLANASFEVHQPDPLAVNILRSGEGNRATADVKGGTPDYTYLWNTGDATQTIEFSKSGTYTVTVTDAQGCDTTHTVMLVTVDAVEVLPLLTTARLYPNPSTGEVFIEFTLQKQLETTLEVWNALGQRITSQNLGKVQSAQIPLNLSIQTAGLYQVTILVEGRRVPLGSLLLVKK